MSTRVLVTGAGGTLGRPLVGGTGGRRLRRRRAHPHARQGSALRALGAEAVVADTLDADAQAAAVRRAAPEVVVHLLTALPAGGPTKASDLEPTNRLRRTGRRICWPPRSRPGPGAWSPSRWCWSTASGTSGPGR